MLVTLAALPATAGEPYTPPALQPPQLVEPPARLIEDATALLRAAEARDPGAAAPFIGANVSVLSGALDMHIPRSVEALGPWIDANAALSELGQHTGGNWYVPEGASLEDVLIDMSLEFWEWSLTDGRPWGRDPLAGEAICTYAMDVFDPAEVARVSEALDINSSAFILVDEATPLLDVAETGTQIATAVPGKLYALDYDTDAPRMWMAVHLPEGGVGFIRFGDEGMGKPYASGICFAEDADGRWQVVAQANTSL